ncbi:hypothetical protein I9H06_16440 [Pseudomonas tremae]|uniref:hypothetical protein n=1 Tax=Pseudomonas tremae TaxID=200454 RepID=UPI0020109A33|nr:hypothetical protein [Pseudomonas tremae]UQB29956.1 hypothetical protein I9H06_16440 [Pseudomonas tremae]
MKLILSRVGEVSATGVDARPFALCTEAGEVLPCQQSTVMTSKPDGPVLLTVVFEVNGRDVIVRGDDA